MNVCEKIRYDLLSMRDGAYREFHAALMPTVNKDKIIGIRVPVLRKYAKKLIAEGNFAPFLSDLPHLYYEENNLHAFLLEGICDFDTLERELLKFLPYVDNWATCDSMRPRALGKDLERLASLADTLRNSPYPYAVRYGIGIDMKYFLDSHFSIEVLDKVAACTRDEYYIRMMQAWFFATALTKQYEATLPYIEKRRLCPWVHNKAISKARESLRVPRERKDYLLTLKIK